MELVWHKTESDGYPELLDTTSSHTSVYIRRNVVEEERPGMEEGETRKVYVCDEAILSKAEYQVYLVDKAATDSNTETQLAIAELAEAILG